MASCPSVPLFQYLNTFLGGKVERERKGGGKRGKKERERLKRMDTIS